MNIREEDILRRVLYRRPYWTCGPPQVVVIGGKGSRFGWIYFAFEDGEVFHYQVYIGKDQKYLPKVAKVAHNAIENYKDFLHLVMDT